MRPGWETRRATNVSNRERLPKPPTFAFKRAANTRSPHRYLENELYWNFPCVPLTHTCVPPGFCAYELAWVDTPDKDGKTHQYAECAARGVCDRETGECECFGGYEGKACGRQTCPDSCSGHGTCEYANELAFGTVYNDYYDGSATAFYGLGVGAHRPAATDTAGHWDADRARACVCDAGWSGVNCVSRMCPWGNDVMDTRLNADQTASGGTLVYQVQTITLFSGGTDGGQKSGVTGSFTFAGGIFGADFVNRAFALSFTSKVRADSPTLISFHATH